MSGHTPGPWGAYVNNLNDVVIRKMFKDGTESHLIANCKSGFANARLIAAAPELLKVLEMVQATLPHIGGNEMSVHNMLKDIEAAIAKARGES